MEEVWAIISPQAQRSIVCSENPPIPQNRVQSRRIGTQAAQPGQERALKERSDPARRKKKTRRRRGGGLLIKDECKDAVFSPHLHVPINPPARRDKRRDDGDSFPGGTCDNSN